MPATLFLNGGWIDAHPQVAADLAANPRFELTNHGRGIVRSLWSGNPPSASTVTSAP